MIHVEHVTRDPNFPDGLSIVPTFANADDKTLVADSNADILEFGIAGRIWEGAEALRRYIQCPSEKSHLEFDPPCSLYRQRHREERLTVVEVGAGAGYVSLHLARSLAAAPSGSRQSNATVILTDLPNVCPLMRRNARKAQLQAARERNTKATAVDEGGDYIFESGVDVLVRPLAWGDAMHASALLSELLRADRSANASTNHTHPITHILVSDCVYFPALLAPLLRALISLSGPPSMAESSNDDEKVASSERSCGPQLIISYKVRSLVKEEPFWRAFGAWFTLEPVCCRLTVDSAREKSNSEGWSRFGEQATHLSADPLQQSKADLIGASNDSEDPSHADTVFVFVAERLPGTWTCRAPMDDGELMSGVRYRRASDGGGDDESGSSIWRKDSSGTRNDAFELLLLGGISA